MMMVSELINTSRDLRIEASDSDAVAYNSGVIPENRVLKSLRCNQNNIREEQKSPQVTHITSTPSSILTNSSNTSLPFELTTDTRATRIPPVE